MQHNLPDKQFLDNPLVVLERNLGVIYARSVVVELHGDVVVKLLGVFLTLHALDDDVGDFDVLDSERRFYLDHLAAGHGFGIDDHFVPVEVLVMNLEINLLRHG